MSDAPAVLDASAVLALLQNEPSADAVAKLVPNAIISAVNLSEVVAKLSDSGMPSEAVRAALVELPIDVQPFDRDLAHDAGELRRVTRQAGLSFGDRACLALARRLGLRAVTMDRAWASCAEGIATIVVLR